MRRLIITLCLVASALALADPSIYQMICKRPAPAAAGGTGWDDPFTPVLWYPMENDRGTITDESLAGNDGAVVAAPLYNYDIRAYKMDNGQYISVSASDGLEPTTAIYGTDSAFSVVFWMNAVDITGKYMANSWDSTRNWNSYFNGEKLLWLIFDVDGDYIGQQSDANLTGIQGSWVQFALTYDASKVNAGLKIYTNGAIHASSAFSSGTYNGATNRANSIFFGKSSGALYADGLFCQYRIYKRELSSAELSTLYAVGRTNEVIDCISTNNLSLYFSCLADDNVRDFGSGGNSGRSFPSPADGVLSIIGMNASAFVGVVEHAEKQDGIDDYIRLASQTGFSGATNGFAFSGWIYRGQDDDAETILSKENTAQTISDFLIMFHNPGTGEIWVRIYEQDNRNIYIGRDAPDFNSGAWHHLGVTYTNETQTSADIKIFVDGVQVDTADRNAGTFTSPSYSTDALLSIGRTMGGTSFFDGIIDEVKFYVADSMPSTQPQIQTLYEETGGKGSPSPNYRDEVRTEP